MSGCAFMERLPAEIRVRIYEYALQHEVKLRRVSSATSAAVSPAKVGILGVSRQVHKEAINVFYDLNAFKVDYSRICTCLYENSDHVLGTRRVYELNKRRRIQAFDAEIIRNLHITAFDPGADDGVLCATCRSSGLGLLEYMTSLPNLRCVTIDFDFVFGFTLFVDGLRTVDKERSTAWKFIGSEVGRITLDGVATNIILRLPALMNVWRRKAMGEKSTKESYQLMGEESIEKAIEYLQFEADDWGRAPSSLSPFFTIGDDRLRAKLRLKSAADSGKRLADFTFAITEVLSDIFMEDGGAESIEWVELEGQMYCLKWVFAEGCYA